MHDPTLELFEWLGRRGFEPLLEQVEGTVRFELADDSKINYWLVTISRGDLRVTRENRDADCVVYSTKAGFDRVAEGADNAIAMLLRAEIIAHGNVQLFVVLERLLPGPPRASDPVSAAHSGAAAQ